MNNLPTADDRIVVHIHEHLGPIRDRLSKMEAIVEGHGMAIGGLKEDIQNLNTKVERNHEIQLKYIHGVKDEMLEAFSNHDAKDNEAFQAFLKNFEEYKEEFNKIKWIVVGGFTTVSALITIATLILDYWNPFK